ncbi:MAG: hypothetical protein ACXWPM_09765, partial [Bdellovibrionota bacterium]
MSEPTMNYFWELNQDIGTENLKAYHQALEGRKGSTLKHLVHLLEQKVPMMPKAYLTSACMELAERKPDERFFNELGAVLEKFEGMTHAQLGGKQKPLLLSVHGDFCGSIRNIGAGLPTLPALVHDHGAPSAYAMLVGFLESFSTLVLGNTHVDFRGTFNIKQDREKGIDGLAGLEDAEFVQKVKQYQNLISTKVGRPFPEDPGRQLLMTILHCVKAAKGAGGDEIFISAQHGRLQFGQSVQGVAYTRHPFTGKKDLYGVYQSGAEGKKASIESDADAPTEERAATLKEKFPSVYGQLKRHLPAIEAAFHDVMESEFVTEEDGKLFFTGFDKAQTTARATVVSTIELNMDGKLPDVEAAMRIKPADVELLLHPTLDDKSRAKLQDIGSTGVTAAPGTAVGHVFFKMADAMEFYREAMMKKTDKRVILVADELLISDTPGLGIIGGLVTRASGIAS